MGLTRIERLVLLGLLQGKSQQRIAVEQDMPLEAVVLACQALYDKLQVDLFPGLARAAQAASAPRDA